MMRLPFFLSLAVTLLGATPVFAHGASIEHRKTSAIEIRATYDGGEPMSNAQVVVYAPDNPTEPFIKGTTTEEGTFIFVPSPEIESGSWDVRVRQSGHGDIVSIPVNNAPDQAQATGGWEGGDYSLQQKVVMIALGVWGFVGTALFFARRQPKNK